MGILGTSRRARLATLAGLVLVWAGAVALRLGAVEYHRRACGDLVFTGGGGLLYYRALYPASGTPLPRVDATIGHPEGVAMLRTFPVGWEYPLGLAHRAFGRGTPADTFRVMVALLSSAGCIAAYLLARELEGEVRSGLSAAVLWATAPAAVAAGCGLNLSAGAVTLPLLAAHVWAGLRWLRRKERPALAAAGLLAAVSISLWAGAQAYAAVFAAWGCWRLLRYGRSDPGAVLAAACAPWLLAAAVAVPYLRAHGVWLSPWMVLICAVAAEVAAGRAAGRLAALPKGSVFAALAAAGLLLAAVHGVYLRSYGPVAMSLVWKVRYLGGAIADPAHVPHYARAMWAGDFAAPGVRRALAGFWILGPLGLWGIWATRRRGAGGDGPAARSLMLLQVSAAGLLYPLFGCFGGPAALGASVFGGCALGSLGRFRHGRAAAAGATALCAAAALATISAGAKVTVGDSADEKALVDVLRFLRTDAPSAAVVLAPEAYAASVAAYAGLPVVLYPDASSPRQRLKSRECAEALISDDPLAFWRLADGWGVDYVVYPRGSAVGGKGAGFGVVDRPADGLPPTVERFEGDQAVGQCFNLVHSNSRFRVFEVFGGKRREECEKLIAAGDALMESGRPRQALAAYARAAKAWRGSPAALARMGRAYSALGQAGKAAAVWAESARLAGAVP